MSFSSTILHVIGNGVLGSPTSIYKYNLCKFLFILSVFAPCIIRLFCDLPSGIETFIIFKCPLSLESIFILKFIFVWYCYSHSSYLLFMVCMAPQFYMHRLYPNQSAINLFLHRGDCPPPAPKSYIFSGTTAFLDLTWWSSEYIAINSFFEDLRSSMNTQVHRGALSKRNLLLSPTDISSIKGRRIPDPHIPPFLTGNSASL